MKLKDYLERLKNCPDEKLTAELGIYDNWPIFLRADFDRMLEFFRNGEYQFHEKFFDIWRFNFIPGTVRLQVINSVGGLMCGTEEERRRQQTDYSMTVLLHPYYKMKMPNTSDVRALTLCVTDIAEHILQTNLPACFPNSRGWGNLKDYSQIIYFPDEIDDEMAALRGGGQK